MLAANAQYSTEGDEFFSVQNHDPSTVLPVYTRLSDAEENERAKIAETSKKNLATGVQHAGIMFRPMAASDIGAVAEIEKTLMKSDSWSASQFLEDITQPTRT